MQIYSAILPTNELLTKDILIQLVIEWNQGSPHNKINGLMWDGKTRNIKFEENHLCLTIEEIRAHNIVAIRFHQIDDNKVIWNTDIVVNFDKHIFSIKLDRETTLDTVDFAPEFKTPVLVNMLLERGYIASDLNLEISDKPIFINEKNYKIIQQVICRDIVYHMPIVYVTKSWKRYPCKVRELAYRLRGIAHVLVEEDTIVSQCLKTKCGGKNAHYGEIGIYYPSSSSSHKIMVTSNYKGNIIINRVVTNVCEYANRQARDRMMTWEGVQNELLRLRYTSAREKKQLAENEVSAVYANFDKELKDNQSTIEELNNRIIALQAENQGLRAKYDKSIGVPLLYYGGEEELYDGEIKDQVLEALDSQLKHISKKSRKEHILRDIIEYNESTGALEEKRKDIKQILKGYTKFTDGLKRSLKDFGFSITKDGGHYKLTFKEDSRYLFTIASSGSDSQHGGENLAHEIMKNLL